MSISAISGSTATSTYSYDNSTSKRKSSQQDPMMQAISQLQSTDPTLASKLQDMSDQVASMKKSGASEKDIQSTIKQTMDGLSSTEKSELQAAMPKHAKGVHRGPPPAMETSDSVNPNLATSATSDAAPSSFSLSSLLDSVSSSQNDAIANFMTSRLATA